MATTQQAIRSAEQAYAASISSFLDQLTDYDADFEIPYKDPHEGYREKYNIEIDVVPDHRKPKTKYYFYGSPRTLEAFGSELEAYILTLGDVKAAYLCTHQPRQDSIFFITFKMAMSYSYASHILSEAFNYVAWIIDNAIALDQEAQEQENVI